MALNNSLVTKPQKTGITAFLSNDAVKGQIVKALGELNSQRFITSVVSAVNNNPNLAECSNQSIFSGALLGESLKLSPSAQLGHFYLVPFDDSKKGKVAQFQLGYKGYIQLAIRSGQYKKLNVMAIKSGELVRFNPLDEEIEVKLVDDYDERDSLETIGYYAMFELVNGYRKAIYWSKKQMEAHALKYSQSYASDKKKGNRYSFWSKDFDAMAYKTMLRQLISKWGIMSIEMQTAYSSDMSVTHEDGSQSYIDSDADVIDATPVEETKEVNQPSVADALFEK